MIPRRFRAMRIQNQREHIAHNLKYNESMAEETSLGWESRLSDSLISKVLYQNIQFVYALQFALTLNLSRKSQGIIPC